MEHIVNKQMHIKSLSFKDAPHKTTIIECIQGKSKKPALTQTYQSLIEKMSQALSSSVATVYKKLLIAPYLNPRGVLSTFYAGGSVLIFGV